MMPEKTVVETNNIFDIQKIRKDFPILHQQIYGKPLVYLDNGATTQKPTSVIEAITTYYESYNSNIHRGAHFMANKATEVYEAARQTAAKFIGAADPTLVNFTTGTTDSINLVANTWGQQNLGAGDEIIVSAMEHHSNIVPWQMLCERKGAKLRVIPVDDNGVLDMVAYREMLSSKTKLVATVWISNSLGTINPVEDIITAAHEVGAIVLLDGAQAAAHAEIAVEKLDVDFLALSAHKVYGPTGMGLLYGKRNLLEEMPPWKGGGEMIDSVSFEGTTYNKLPYKFEAGTPNICGGIAFGAALEYVNSIGKTAIAAHEDELLKYGTSQLEAIDGLKMYGSGPHKASILSFTIEGVHPYDLGVLLDRMGIAVRTGHHCCQPLMEQYGIEGTCRASLAVYNTLEEIDLLRNGIEVAIQKLR